MHQKVSWLPWQLVPECWSSFRGARTAGPTPDVARIVPEPLETEPGGDQKHSRSRMHSQGATAPRCFLGATPAPQASPQPWSTLLEWKHCASQLGLSDQKTCGRGCNSPRKALQPHQRSRSWTSSRHQNPFAAHCPGATSWRSQTPWCAARATHSSSRNGKEPECLDTRQHKQGLTAKIWRNYMSHSKP